MQWKQVQYSNGKHNIVFEIIPMIQDSDIIIVPTAHLWCNSQNVFSNQERMEIIFLFERIDWKRDIRVIEANIEPEIDLTMFPVNGSIESTLGYQEFTKKIFLIHKVH